MLIRKKEDCIFVTDLDDRQLTEIRRLSRPKITHAERRAGLVEFIERHDDRFVEAIHPDDKIYVWA